MPCPLFLKRLMHKPSLEESNGNVLVNIFPHLEIIALIFGIAMALRKSIASQASYIANYTASQRATKGHIERQWVVSSGIGIADLFLSFAVSHFSFHQAAGKQHKHRVSLTKDKAKGKFFGLLISLSIKRL